MVQPQLSFLGPHMVGCRRPEGGGQREALVAGRAELGQLCFAGSQVPSCQALQGVQAVLKGWTALFSTISYGKILFS